tara:strand:+ start:161 stop:415 length:255 start_codon:yes stop_codon:yes gene_type:complete
MTYEELKARAHRIILNMMDQHEKAPARGSYNRLLGKYTTAQRDVINAATANLKLVNQVSQMLHGKDVVTFVDDEVDLPTIRIND